MVNTVIAQARKEQYPLIQNMELSPENGPLDAKSMAASSAPSFPALALNPWHKDLTWVGNISAGNRNVVQLGPHCPKKEEPRYARIKNVEERRF
mmetsp:Transcript_4072/g.5609  ORF Transcript_4072/g.5609 Transcript_4072/m.5609 type:complete len:94 (+) Transcript_4072:497-778(+)